jgi:hypothetical protein
LLKLRVFFPHAHPDPSGTILRSMWPGHVQLELFLHQLRSQGGWEDDDGRTRTRNWRVYDSNFFSHQNVSIVRIFTQFYSMRKSNCPVRYLMLPHLSRFDWPLHLWARRAPFPLQEKTVACTTPLCAFW